MMAGTMSAGGSGAEDEPQDTPDTDADTDTPDTPEPPDPTPEEPEEPDEPEVVGDTGATFAFSNNTVTLELGEDETGSLAVIHYVDEEPDGQDSTTSDEARFYLVPEDVDWSEADWETRWMVPGATDFGGDEYAYYLSDFEDHFGLELLGVVDFQEDPDALSGGILANAPVAGYSLDANGDGDELVMFLPDDAPETRNGVEETQVSADTTGSDQSDWLTTQTDGVTLDGAAGDDYLEAFDAEATLVGGAGDDVLNSTIAPGSVNSEGNPTSTVIAVGGQGDDSIFLLDGAAEGGAGDDNIWVTNGTATGDRGDDSIDLFRGDAYGGDGNDTITGLIEGRAYGGEGDDWMYTQGAGSAVLYGQAGDDFVGVDDGATGNGGAGNDRIQIDAGGTGFGGTGDDTFNIFVRADDTETAVATGGTGADTYTFTLGNPFSDDDTEYLRITDFDPDEDSLTLDAGYAARVGDISIETAPDGSHTNVTVEYIRTAGNIGSGVTTAVIRLDGTPEITRDQIGIVS